MAVDPIRSLKPIWVLDDAFGDAIPSHLFSLLCNLCLLLITLRKFFLLIKKKRKDMG